jgi:hypothetical protein
MAALKALDTTAAARAIPGGMPAELLRRVLLVYSDLVSRSRSLTAVLRYSSLPALPTGGQDARDVLRCLGNGAPAAARFDADLASARALAEATQPVTVAPPDSRATAEVAVRVSFTDLANSGCGSCGGEVFTRLPTLIWQPKDEPYVGHSDGTVNGIRFRANYQAGRGWDVMIWAC